MKKIVSILLALILSDFAHAVNLVDQITATVQESWPGAEVVERGKNYIVHANPNNPAQKRISAMAGTPLFKGEGPFEAGDEIDTAWENNPTPNPYFYRMLGADYEAYAGLNANASFGAGQIVQYRDPSSGATISFQPQDLNWTNDFDSSAWISSPQNVSCQFGDDDLYWAGAYGAGRNFLWQTSPAQLRKELILDSLAALGAPPGWFQNNPALKLQFLFQVSAGVNIWINGAQWNKSTTITTTSPVLFKNAQGVTLWQFQPGTGIDANGDTAGFTRFTASGSVLFVEVIVPWTWLQTAVYPVRVDPTINQQVAASADDAYERKGNTSFSSTAIDVRMDDNTTVASAIHGGFRFPSTGIPQGATISAATLTVNCTGTTADDPETVIHAEDVDAPDDYSTTADVADRVLTTAGVAWSGTSVGAGTEVSPDFTSVIQEVVDRGGFGGTINIITDPPNTTTKVFRVTSYDGNSALAAILDVTYSTGGGARRRIIFVD